MTMVDAKFVLPDSPLDLEVIDICGVAAERVRTGAGQPLLYLHDGGGLEYSAEFIEALSGSFQVHALSHPGFGNTQLPSHFRSVDDIVHFYLDYIEQEKLTDLVLVGAQFGGWIAAELATSGTSRLSSLVLIDANGIKVGARDKQDVVDIFYLLPEQVRELGWYEMRPARRSISQEGAMRLARNRETLALFGWSPLMHNPQLVHRLHRIKVPTLVLWGDSDRLSPVEYGRAYAKAVPGSTFKLIERAGNLPHVEQAGMTLEEIRSFVEACGGKRG